MRGKGGRSSKGSSNSLKKLSKVSSETVVICVLLVVLLVLVIYYVKQNNEGFQNNNAEKCDVYVFVADWCPHCKNAKPAIAELKNNAPANVTVNVVNESDANSRELMTKYKVRGFPTIFLVKADGTMVEFVERVSADNLNNFVVKNSTN